MTVSIPVAVKPRWSRWQVSQRAAGDWVVQQRDTLTQTTKRWLIDGDDLTEAEAREIAAMLNGAPGPLVAEAGVYHKTEEGAR